MKTLTKPREILPEFEIHVENLVREVGFSYELIFPDGERYGHGKFVIKKVHSWVSCSFIYEGLLNGGLDTNSVVAQITDFFPHTYLSDDFRYRRRSIGSKLLKHLTEDAKSLEAKAIVCITPSPSMQAFLRARDFCTGNSKDLQSFYRIL